MTCFIKQARLLIDRATQETILIVLFVFVIIVLALYSYGTFQRLLLKGLRHVIVEQQERITRHQDKESQALTPESLLLNW